MNRMTKLISTAALMSAMAFPVLAGGNGASMTVYKNPWCGCCEVWLEAMQAAGYDVTVRDMEDLDTVKKQAGVPSDMEACHTATLDVGGRKYAIEGHVPLQAMEKLMSERPDVRGIAVPGMPGGSLGMGYDENARYDVYSFAGRSDERPQVFYEAGK